jgi:protein-S-isoprenylcysteine O-methyltransferase Ste14
MKQTSNNPNRKQRLRSTLLLFLVSVIFIIILFVSAGSLTWFWGWMWTGIIIIYNIIGIMLLDPGLLEERTGIKSGIKRVDIFLALIMGRLGPLAIIITSGLDFRFGWSGSFPLVLAVLGIVFLILGYFLVLWAMKENRFFSSVIRIQRERGHQVITTGPYQIVRHPGYLGSIIYTIGLPFALTSYWALIPAIVIIIFSILRTVLEDNILKQKLENYSNYAESVRYRLIPGIW